MDGLLLFPILILLMYFMILRPQQKARKEQAAMLASLDVGDDVVTDSGIYGTVSDLDGGTVFLMVADGIELKIGRANIAKLTTFDGITDEA